MSQNPDTDRALAAAQAVASANGLAFDDAVVLAAGSNVLVRFQPAPVIARVMTGTVVLHGDIETWLTREVAAGTFLGERGVAAPPTHLLPPGPHEFDGLWMTFWEFVEHEATLPAADELGRSLRAFHGAFAEYSGELGRLGDIRDWLAGLTDDPQLHARLQELTPTVFESSLPAQGIHGDACMGNLLRTGSGMLWNDLEDVCRGPVQWDVAGLVAEARDIGRGEAFVEEFLDAYGGLALDELGDFIAAHDLYSQIWQTHAASQRTP